MKRQGGNAKAPDNRRVSRVEMEVQRVVSSYLITYMQTELNGLITVSRVKMPADLRSAKVYVSVLGNDVNMKDVISLLQSRAPEVQDEISHKLKMRYCPKLTFFKDDTTEQILKIDKALQEIGVGKKSNSTDED